MQALLIFSLPIILGNLFQQTYTMADSAIVGRFVSEQALAAVGASYSLTNIFICVAIGGGNGSFRYRRTPFRREAVPGDESGHLYGLSCFSGSERPAGRAWASVQQADHDGSEYAGGRYGMAVQYLNIYFYGLPFLFMYNVLSSMFNALGSPGFRFIS